MTSTPAVNTSRSSANTTRSSWRISTWNLRVWRLNCTGTTSSIVKKKTNLSHSKFQALETKDFCPFSAENHRIVLKSFSMLWEQLDNITLLTESNQVAYLFLDQRRDIRKHKRSFNWPKLTALNYALAIRWPSKFWSKGSDRATLCPQGYWEAILVANILKLMNILL